MLRYLNFIISLIEDNVYFTDHTLSNYQFFTVNEMIQKTISHYPNTALTAKNVYCPGWKEAWAVHEFYSFVLFLIASLYTPPMVGVISRDCNSSETVTSWNPCSTSCGIMTSQASAVEL